MESSGREKRSSISEMRTCIRPLHVPFWAANSARRGRNRLGSARAVRGRWSLRRWQVQYTTGQCVDSLHNRHRLVAGGRVLSTQYTVGSSKVPRMTTAYWVLGTRFPLSLARHRPATRADTRGALPRRPCRARTRPAGGKLVEHGGRPADLSRLAESRHKSESLV